MRNTGGPAYTTSSIYFLGLGLSGAQRAHTRRDGRGPGPGTLRNLEAYTLYCV